MIAEITACNAMFHVAATLCGYDRELRSRATEALDRAAISTDPHPVGRYRRLLPDPITPSVRKIRKGDSGDRGDHGDTRDGHDIRGPHERRSSTHGSGHFEDSRCDQRSNGQLVLSCALVAVTRF